LTVTVESAKDQATEGRIIVTLRIYQDVLTPELARQLLSRRRSMRLKSHQVKRLVGIIERGEWHLTPDSPVCTDEDGFLWQGVHRCLAVIETGASVPVLRVENLSKEATTTLDTAARRSFADNLKDIGVPSSTNIAAVATLLWHYERGQLKSRASWGSRTSSGSSPTSAQLLPFYEKYEQEIAEGFAYAHNTYRKTQLTPSVAGVAWVIFSRINKEDAEGFFRELTLETPQVPYGGPHLFTRVFAGWGHRKPDQQVILAHLIKAWNMYRDGREGNPGTKIQWMWGGSKREAFPEPR